MDKISVIESVRYLDVSLYYFLYRLNLINIWIGMVYNINVNEINNWIAYYLYLLQFSENWNTLKMYSYIIILVRTCVKHKKEQWSKTYVNVSWCIWSTLKYLLNIYQRFKGGWLNFTTPKPVSDNKKISQFT